MGERQSPAAPLSEAQARALEDIRKDSNWMGTDSDRNRYVRFIRRGNPADVLLDETERYESVVHGLRTLFRVLGRAGLTAHAVALIERAEALQERTGEPWPWECFYEGIIAGGSREVLERFLSSPLFQPREGQRWMALRMDEVVALDDPGLVELLLPWMEAGFSVAATMGSAIAKAGAGRILRWAVGKHGLDPRRWAWGARPIQVVAAAKMKAEDYRWLLENWSLDLSATTRSGTTAAHAAAESDRPDILEILRERGADMEARDHEGDTPLLSAAMAGSLESLAFLGASGSSAGARNFAGEDVLLRFARGITRLAPGHRTQKPAPETGPESGPARVEAAWPVLEALGVDPRSMDAEGRAAVNLVLMTRLGAWKPNDPENVAEARFFMEVARRFRAHGVPFQPVLPWGHDEIRALKSRYGEESARFFAAAAALATDPGTGPEEPVPLL